MTDLDHEKKIAALEAIKYIEEGMIVGLGTGSTAQFMIRALGERVLTGLKIQGIPSSKATRELALECHIPLITLKDGERIDVTIDGADEFDPYLQLIKGGGGALLHEKILAYNSDLYIIIADSKKQVERLGTFKLPVESIPFATYSIIQTLTDRGLRPILRESDGEVFITAEGNYIIDLDIRHATNLTELELSLKQVPGIVETGLFLHMADIIIMGKEKDTVLFKR
ncbi:MAG TPA: ribose-5-phosphate isomerase RpiA [Arenibacter sp.]|nr:ribose-5-phosphate isomerase RpiA [Arenibacter sp.]